MGKKVYLTFETSLTDICEINSSFDKGTLRVCYAGENRNKSFIDKEDLIRCAKTLPYVPVVGNYIREDDDFGGHDIEIVTDGDGQLRMVNKTQPVGVVPADAEIFIDTFTDDNGEEHEYLYTTVLLWKRQEAYKKIKEDGIVSHSMEITVKSGEMVDGLYHIYDFEFTALCLLGENVEPCFEDSALEVFTTSDFKAQFELMMNDFKESFNLATTSIEDNYSQDKNLEKGGEEDLEMNKDVFTEEEVVETESTDEEFAEEVVDEVVEEAVEEAPEEFEEAKEDAEEEPEEEEEETSEEFALSRQINDALCEILFNTDRIQEGDYDYARYFFVDSDIEKGIVYFEDSADDWKLFGCNFSMDGDNVVVDFESKRRMKIVFEEFDEGSQAEEPMSIFAIIQKETQDRTAATYQAKIDDYESQITELQEFKHAVETESEVNARNEIFEKFEDLAEIEEFKNLRDNMLDYDVASLEEKCYALRGRNMINPTSTNFSMNTSMPKFIVESNGVKSLEESDEPYGGMVEKYLGK